MSLCMMRRSSLNLCALTCASKRFKIDILETTKVMSRKIHVVINLDCLFLSKFNDMDINKRSGYLVYLHSTNKPDHGA